jgi:DNA-binding LacI/PurR family transcriptional regulator
MSKSSFLTITQQVAQHLRAEIFRGRWSGTMPGKPFLVAELEINHKTVDAALRLLEDEGLLVSQGAGRKRQIVLPADGGALPRLRIGMMLWNESDRGWSYMVDLQHRLTKAGHTLVAPRKTLIGLKMDAARVARLVEQTEADAWIVVAGSQDVLQWFAKQKFPTFALFGRFQDLPIAAVGAAKAPACVKVTKSLIELGHRRIVMLLRRHHRLPQPTPFVSVFLDTLKSHGIPISPFCLPDWEETPAGFQECLKALFRVTPPSALIVDELRLYLAICHFLVARGLRVPRDVSLVCIDNDADLEWCVPTIARVHTDLSKMSRPVLRWADNVSQGKIDIRQTAIKIEYVPGGTVGPALLQSVVLAPGNRDPGL